MKKTVLVQTRNPKTKMYVLINKTKGKIVGSQKQKYKGIPVVKRKRKK